MAKIKDKLTLVIQRIALDIKLLGNFVAEQDLQAVTDNGNVTNNIIKLGSKTGVDSQLHISGPNSGIDQGAAQQASLGQPVVYGETDQILIIRGHSLYENHKTYVGYLPVNARHGIIDNIAVNGNSFTLGDGWNFGYITNNNIAVSNTNPFVNIRLRPNKWHDERIKGSGTTADQVLQFPPEDGTLATREWFGLGDDESGADIPSNEPGFTIMQNGELKYLRAGDNLSVRSDGKFLDAKNTEYTAGSNIQISNNGVIAATNTTYSAGTAALINTGTNTSNRIWSAKILADYVKAQIEAPRQMNISSNTVYGIYAGYTFMINSSTSNLVIELGAVNVESAEYYFYNNTNVSRTLIIGQSFGANYQRQDGSTSISVILKPRGLATIIRIGTSNTYLALGDIE